jgi:gluconate 5-dehydrogenase
VPTPHPNPFHLDGRFALVTGGGSGIGLAIARGLARAGARVAINGRSIPKLEQAAATLLAEDIDVLTLPFDVADETAVGAAMATLARQHGAPDILVNNAATNLRKPLEDFTLEQWRGLQAANVDGPFLVTRAVIPGMKARGQGKIINICSLASDLGRPNIVPYAASKGGLKMLTRALAVELAPHNIQVNGLAPGFFDTEMNAPLVADAQFSAWIARRVPAGRWAKPDEIAGAAVFLASPAADFVTGHILHVDGGFAAAY